MTPEPGERDYGSESGPGSKGKSLTVDARQTHELSGFSLAKPLTGPLALVFPEICLRSFADPQPKKS